LIVKRWKIILLLAAVWTSQALASEPLAGTAPLTMTGDPAALMVSGIDRFLDRQTELSLARRATYWKRDYSSPQAYERSLAPNRARLRKILGVVDERLPCKNMEVLSSVGHSAILGGSDVYEIRAVRWPVLPGVDGEGLLLCPKNGDALADCIVLPDCDSTPEALIGVANTLTSSNEDSGFVRYLADARVRVLMPILINRHSDYSAISGRPSTGQPHREWIYRQAFEMGRHIQGYEIQKVLAAAEWFRADRGSAKRKLGLIGFGEGGTIALAAGAIDTGIDAVGVSAAFHSRQRMWEEPIDHNVWGFLTEFGDAELSAMIAPRTLMIEAAQGPSFSVPAASKGPTPGKLETPALADVQAEFQRARKLAGAFAPESRFRLIETGRHSGPRGSMGMCIAFLEGFLTNNKGTSANKGSSALKTLLTKGPQLTDIAEQRQKRQFDQLVEFTQKLVRQSDSTRGAFWAKADRKSRSPEAWEKTIPSYRDYLSKEVIGQFNEPLLPLAPKSRLLYERPTYCAYEVTLDVFPDVFAYGWLLLPKDLKPGERRPVVVCQHGLEGRPADVADPKIDSQAYHRYGCRLAEEGFIVFAPQNPYIFKDRFRTLQRKANPLGKSLYSIIVPQHRQIVAWLASLPMVDPKRIGFYGLSYGGKTAMRVPALVEGYCLSICSADFNEWVWKNTSVTSPYSYMGMGEYEMVEFDLGNTFNYAEMAGLIAPRPFMVERGHRDGVAPDEWVAYEYAKVRLLYADLRIPDRTRIEFFEGPHTIHGVGTFEFLHKHLRWPAVKE
jgi:dienelactone hydrolase